MKDVAMKLIAAGAILASAGCGTGKHTSTQETDPARTAKVEEILREMTVRQKVAQLVVIAIDSRQGEQTRSMQDSLVSEDGIGGLIVMDDSLLPTTDRINQLQGVSNVPLLVCVDGEWGPSMRFSEFPFFPRQMQLGALTSDDLVYKMGLAVGEQCRLAHIQVNFAPVVDININPANPVIHTRSFGEDKHKVAQYGSAYMRGMQDAGIYACAKHFPGHGDTNVDSHKGLPVLDFSRERLDSVELLPFRRLIEDGVAMVMMGHLSIPALDSTAVSSVSRPIVTGLLKEELGFGGIVVTDALTMKGVSEGRSYAEVALEAYKAGVDILLMPGEPRNSIDLIEKEVLSGALPMDELDDKVRRMLLLKAGAGMLDEGYEAAVDTLTILEKVQRPQDEELSREISRQSMTVLRNESVLPLPMRDARVAYLGYAATWQPRRFRGGVNGLAGFDAASGVKADGHTVLGDALAERGVDCFYLPKDAPVEALDSLVAQMEGYDLVVVGFHDGSARPHRDLVTDEAHSELFAQWAQRQRLLGVFFGSPYALDAMPWESSFAGFMVCYADIFHNEEAAAQILLGRLPSRGVLPVSAGSYKCGHGLKIK